MRLRLFLPSALLVLVAIGWSAFWYYAASEAGRQLDLLTVRQAAAGRTLTCTDRSIGGFPFRLELRCGASALEMTTPQGLLALEAAGVAAVVQLPYPTHVIFELASPVTIGQSLERPEFSLAFKTFRGSLHGAPSRFERASLQVEDPLLSLPLAPGTLVDGGRAAVVDLHLRRSQSSEAGAFDLLFKAVDTQLPAIDSPLAKTPTDVEVQLAATRLDTLLGGDSTEALRAFADAGGRAHLALLRADQADITAEAKGDLALEPSGRPTGSLALSIANAGKLVSLLSAAGVPGLYSALLLGKPATLDGKPASAYALRLEDGRVMFGSVTLGRVAPLF